MTRLKLQDMFVHGAGVAVTLFTILLALISAPAWAADVDYHTDGSLKQPQGYREWIYVGAPVTPNDMNGGEAAFPEFHSVYINPEAWEAYQKTGKFPDGTVLIKELISVATKKASSGNGYFMGDFIGLEAAVKDSKRFSKLPGSWAYFSFGHSYPLARTAKPQPRANCAACHQAQAADDFVFTQYYPVLRAVKGKGM